jgi:hypothetical protein
MVEQSELLDLTIAAADYWESRLHDPLSIDIQVGFSREADRAAALAIPYAFTGIGLIGVSRLLPFFADATPLDTSEFAIETLTFSDLGTGPMNTGVGFSGATGDASAGIDLFTILLHEVAHAIVFQITNEIGAGLPFAGTSFPTTGAHLDFEGALMHPNAGLIASPFTGRRTLPSDLDILATATWGGFTQVTLNELTVDEPSNLALLILGVSGLPLVRRRLGAERKATDDNAIGL